MTIQNHKEQQDECELVFVKQSHFWRWVVSGIVFIVMFGAGIVGWSYQPLGDIQVLKTNQTNLDKRLDKMELQYHAILDKLDIIIQGVNKK